MFASDERSRLFTGEVSSSLKSDSYFHFLNKPILVPIIHFQKYICYLKIMFIMSITDELNVEIVQESYDEVSKP